jgi:hypothetical protein
MSAAPVIWKHIGLHGHSVGTIVCEPARVVWKSALTGRDDEASTTKSIPAATVRAAHWTLFGKSGHLRLKIKANSGKNLKHEYRFDGFPLADFDLLKETIKKHYKLDLQQISMSAAGAQYGMTSIQSKNLVFRHCVLDEMNEEGQELEPREEEEMMSLDLAEVSQVRGITPDGRVLGKKPPACEFSPLSFSCSAFFRVTIETRSNCNFPNPTPWKRVRISSVRAWRDVHGPSQRTPLTYPCTLIYSRRSFLYSPRSRCRQGRQGSRDSGRDVAAAYHAIG